MRFLVFLLGIALSQSAFAQSADQSPAPVAEPVATPVVATPATSPVAITVTPATVATAASTSADAELSARDAIVLGVIEGVTEFLPVSSTGHLIIANAALGHDSEKPVLDAQGQPVWFKPPSAKHPEGQYLTPKLAADTFVIVIQFGAIAAVIGLYWKQIRSILLGLVGRDSGGLRLARNLIVAFIPAAVLGLAFHDWIEKNLFSIKAVVIAQVLGAILMFIAEKWRRNHAAAVRPTTQELSTADAFGIGMLQCVSLWPGTSRSMMTIVGGYFAGLDPRRSAEFSFLLGLVTLTAATAYKCKSAGGAMIDVFGWSSILLGCAVAAVTAALSIKFLVHYLTRHGLGLFAVYRLAFAALLAAWFLV